MIEIVKILFLAMLVYFAWIGVRLLRELNKQNERNEDILKLYKGIKEIDLDK